MIETPPVANVPSTTGEAVTYRFLLRNRNFRLLWLGAAASTFGSYFTRIAIPIYVFDLTGSYLQLGLAAFSSLSASLLFGLLAGALADRWNRRDALLGVDIASGFLMALLTLLVLLPLSTPWKLASLYLVSFFAGVLRELFNAARVAIFPELLSQRDLLAANALDQGTTSLSELLSYPLAGLILFYM